MGYSGTFIWCTRRKAAAAPAQQLEDAITSNTKLVMYSSPCNPTGSVFSKEELEEFGEELEKYRGELFKQSV